MRNLYNKLCIVHIILLDNFRVKPLAEMVRGFNIRIFMDMDGIIIIYIEKLHRVISQT